MPGSAPRGARWVGDGALPLAHFKRVVDINLVGTFNVLRLVAEQMATHDPGHGGTVCRGVIINTASVAAYEGQIGQAAYSASKGGRGWHDAADCARFYPAWVFEVNTIAPGSHQYADVKGIAGKRRRLLWPLRCCSQSAWERPQKIAQVAQSIVENDYINGEVIRMDGGIRMQPK